MRDFNLDFHLFNQQAGAEIEVLDWEKLIEASATGTIEVDSYAGLLLENATGSIVIVDYTELADVSFTVGGNVLVEGVDFNAETSNDQTATNLASAIDALTGIGASATTNTVNITSSGSAGNEVDLATDADPAGATLSGAFLTGGQDHGEITVGADTIVQGVGFNAQTNNDTTATNIASAIDALTGVSAVAVGNVVTITATAGIEGNGIVLEADVTEGSLTLSGETLEGGQDHAEITIGEDTIVQGTDFTAETSNNVTATNIASEIDSLTGYNASADGAVVSIFTDAIGEDGNETVLSAEATEGGLDVGAFSGGEDEYVSESFDYDSVVNSAIEISLNVDSIEADTDLTVTVEVSDTKDSWQEVYTFTATDEVSLSKVITDPKNFARFKITSIGGASVGSIYGKTTDAEAETENQYFYHIDTSFVTGESGVIHDIKGALGAVCQSGYISNDGAGSLAFAIDSGNGFGSEITLLAGEVHEFIGLSVERVRITWVADTSYRIYTQ